ncbi:hypothetical protein Tco_0827825 [Tanacetum coccineum]
MRKSSGVYQAFQGKLLRINRSAISIHWCLCISINVSLFDNKLLTSFDTSIKSQCICHKKEGSGEVGLLTAYRILSCLDKPEVGWSFGATVAPYPWSPRFPFQSKVHSHHRRGGWNWMHRVCKKAALESYGSEIINLGFVMVLQGKVGRTIEVEVEGCSV